MSLGALVWVNSPSSVFVTLPSWILSVMSLLFLPGSPSWVTFCSPGFRELSNSIFVSNGTSTSSVIVWVPSLTPSPTKITAFLGCLVTVGSEVFITLEFSIVRVFSCSPFSPFNSLPSSSVAYFHSPFLSDGSFLTSTSNGISSLTFSVPLVLPPILTTLFWPASSVSEVTTFFWSLS